LKYDFIEFSKSYLSKLLKIINNKDSVNAQIYFNYNSTLLIKTTIFYFRPEHYINFLKLIVQKSILSKIYSTQASISEDSCD